MKTSDYPDIAKLWDYEKNKKEGLNFEETMPGSSKKVWWICDKGHEWQAAVYNIVGRGSRCPYCSGKKVIVGENDLYTRYPHLVEEWDYDNNQGLTPQSFTPGSSKKVWWKCSSCGNKWMAAIGTRSKGHGCPKCGVKKVGDNNATIKDPSKSLLAVFPKVINVWNYEKNNGLRPEEVYANSNRKVWWKCSACGKEWQSPVCGRITKSGRTTCRSCSLKGGNRVFVHKGVNDLATVFPKVAKEWNYEKNNGLKPSEVTARSSNKVWWICDKGHEWQALVLNRTRDGYRGCPYCAHRRVNEENCLQAKYPHLVKEWDYRRNNGLTPEEIASASNKKVWWICDKGHEWQATPNARGSRHTGCPYCANRKLLKGFNDLATKYPLIAKEWNYKKNKNLLPQDVISNSGKKVWWICDKGHEWQATPNNRVSHQNCPYCTNRKVLAGFNDLATTNPSLAAEWNYKKNKGISPQNIIAGSPKKVWWICENGHEWQASIVSRNRGHYCPICDTNKHTSISEKAFVYYLRFYGFKVEENKKIERKELDVFIPELNTGIEYDGQYYHRNIGKDLTKNALCKKLGIKLIRIREPELPHLDGYSKDIYIHKLESSGYSHLNTPITATLRLLDKSKEYDINVDRDLGKIYELFQVSSKKDSILEEYPELIKEWDYSKNDLPPEKLSKGSHYNAWWKCSKCGHEWQAKVYSRCQGFGCKKCGFKKGSDLRAAVKNPAKSLAIVFPESRKIWDREKNGSLKPEDVLAGSQRKVWWKCPICGKEWEQAPYYIVKKHQGMCAKCSNSAGIRPLRGGDKSVLDAFPEASKVWNYEKNGNLKPENVSAGSNKKVWWKCAECGKEWQASVYNKLRHHRTTCVDCSKRNRTEQS